MEQQLLGRFFEEFELKCKLDNADRLKLRNDYEKAILYYCSHKVGLSIALDRLDTRNMGDFYSYYSNEWFPLDSAAKLYPLTLQHGQMSVFRLSFYLVENVIPELLQVALNFTIKRFPSFATSVKKGFFWHYLDSIRRRYPIEVETEVPCTPMNISRSGSPSFRVVYYQNRISVEFFHILTDGTGGTRFIETLIVEYFRLKGIDINQSDSLIWSTNVKPLPAEMKNAFSVSRNTSEGMKLVDKPALQMSGRLSRRKPCQVLHFLMDMNEVKQVAQKRNTTITAYILSLMFVACKSATTCPAGDINIQVPVNMRKFIASSTIRNFAMYCGIRIPIKQIYDSVGILNEISNQLSEKTSQEAMLKMMSSTEKTVCGIRMIPLIFKEPLVKFAFSALGDRAFSTTLSNLGVIKVPEALESEIKHMDFVLGTNHFNRISCGMITFKQTIVLSISKMTQNTIFEQSLEKLLLDEGIKSLTVQGSRNYAN